MSVITSKAVDWIESGLLPDPIIRAGVRRLLESKRKEISSGDVEYAAEATNDLVSKMNASPVAILPEIANRQHYEIPAEFFSQVLGDFHKYSCGYWPENINTLTQAESAALDLSARRADIADGMRILDLGCGWGSFSLWIAERFPNATVTAVTNSYSQRDFIVSQASELALQNVTVIACDVNDFEPPTYFDRVVSIEMFEHMRNYRELFRRIDSWLVPDGLFFMHIFCHKTTPYEFLDKGPSDWMSRHFFTGGIMPSADLPLRFSENLSIAKRWNLNGQHYAKTCNAWLENMKKNENAVMPLLAQIYGEANAALWWQRWLIFFVACSELFDYDQGQEWHVGHYLFKKKLG
ncbi:MAG: cyclopropane-fatty-acyl-phospholipid synthase family protein [Pseudomonadota bacterium]